MITKDEALSYSEQLHPAFAGYLEDGDISDKDVLGTIFKLILDGIISPIWEDDSMQNRIKGLRYSRKKCKYEFEQLIINQIFQRGEVITSDELGRIISNGTLQEIIQNNLSVIAEFPLIGNELNLTLGSGVKVNYKMAGDPINTVRKANHIERLLRIFAPIFIFSFIGFSLILYNYIYSDSNLYDKFIVSMISLLFIIFGFIGIIKYTSFKLLKKEVTYTFKDNIIPLAKKKFTILHDFIQEYPLHPHIITNEFLPYSIAFGLDNSWQEDFGLYKELKLDESPLINS